tara:strand:+ start:610 stop:954 length:345 start_codon:yes stop_codon:yes gene_type:complete
MAGYSFQIVPGKQDLLDRLQAAKHFAKLQNRAKSLHRNMISRWFSCGVRGIRLPAILIGGKKFTSIEAIDWWIQATTAADAAAMGSAGGQAVTAPLTTEEVATLEAAGISVAGV